MDEHSGRVRRASQEGNSQQKYMMQQLTIHHAIGHFSLPLRICVFVGLHVGVLLGVLAFY